MKQSQLVTLVEASIGPRMQQLGFSHDGRVYFRELPSGVIHLMTFSLDIRSDNTFQVLCGLGARALYGDSDFRKMGLIGARQLTLNGWSCNSGRWSCVNVPKAQESLSQIGHLIDSIAEPWFQEHSTLSDVAEEEESRFGIEKAKLYLADGDTDKAFASLHGHLEFLSSASAWMSSEKRAKEEAETRTLLMQFEN